MAEFEKKSDIEVDCGSVDSDDVRQVKTAGAGDESERISMTQIEYEKVVQRLQVVDGLYEQLDDEKRRRIEITGQYRNSAATVVRLNNLVMHYRQMLIKNRLQPDDATTTDVGAELTEAIFSGEGEEFELLRGPCLVESGSETFVEDWADKMVKSTCQHSALESDDVDVAALLVQVSDDAELRSSHDQMKVSTAAAAAGDVGVRGFCGSTSPRHHQHDEVVDDAAARTIQAAPTRSSTSATAESNDLLQKVMNQNARLKELLRKIVDTKGMTIRDFLERSDYVELVQKLQSEVAQLRSQVKDQQQQLRADDKTLTAQCAALTQQVQKLKQSSTVKQALIDVYGPECSRLQSEVKRLSSADVIGSKGNSQDQQQPVVALRDEAVNIQKLSEDFIKLKQKYSDAEKLHQSRVNELELSLKQERERAEHFGNENKTLNDKFTDVANQICIAAARKTSEPKVEGAMKPVSSCGAQSRHIDRPWTTRLPQTGLMVDSPEPLTLSDEQQHQQQHVADENIKAPARQPTPPESSDAAASADATERFFTCQRCEQDFGDKERFEKHCKKCTDD